MGPLDVQQEPRPADRGADVAQGFFTQVLAQAEAKQLLSDEPFSVDGTLIEAWATARRNSRRLRVG